MAGIVLAKDTWRYVEDDAPRAMRAAIRTHWKRVPVLQKLGL